MEGPPRKICKKESNETKDEPHSVDTHPQDDCEPQWIAQPPLEPLPEAGTPQAFLQSMPTEADIRTHVCQKAGNKWPGVCTYLGVSLSKVQMARGNNPHQEEDACFEAVMHWRSGNTSVTVKWAELLEALKRAGLGDVADSIAVQNGVEPVKVRSDFPEPLQHARRLAYNRYLRPTFAKKQKVQFTKVAVLEGAPKAKKEGNLDQGELLKRYRDCGIRMSEGASEQMTVNDFLHKGPQLSRIIYGQPGTGKTTLLKHLCQKIANNEPSDFSLVLFFPLRDKAVSQALKCITTSYDCGLESLLQYYIPDKTRCADVVRELLHCQGNDILIIFDGADEVRDLLNDPEGALLASFLEGHVLPQAHFVVSTRHGGCPILQEHCTLFYEILGFDEEAVKSFVKDFFENEPGKGVAMLSDLSARPDLMGGTYIPMNLLILCSIYEHGVAGRSVFPATMTECYKSSIARIVTREKREKEKKAYQIGQSLNDLPPDVQHLLSSLGVLAFKGITQEPPNYIFQEADVRPLFSIPPDQPLDESSFSGLLHLHSSQDSGYSTHSSLNFSHTTKQEFFAAYHLSMLPEAEQADFWRENHQNPKFAVVLRYFAGLTRFKSAEVSEAILGTGDDLPSTCDTRNPYLLYVFHALFESQNESLTQSIATHLNSCLTFYLYLTPFDTLVLRHCLSQCKHLTKLHTSAFPSHSLSPSSFHHVRSVVQCNPLLHSLTLFVDQFSTKDARGLCEAAGSLKRLTLEMEQSCTSETLAQVFDHKPLEELDLTLLSAVESDHSVVEKMVAYCWLKGLKLRGDSTLLLPVLRGVKDNRSIADLVIFDDLSSSSNETSLAVAACVQNMPQLKTLDIHWINPLPVFQSLSQRCSPQDSVTVNPPWFVSDEEMIQLEEAASCAKVVKVKVNVWYSAKASRALAAGFSKNPLLTNVELGKIPEELVESLRGTLCTNTALTVKVSDMFIA